LFAFVFHLSCLKFRQGFFFPCLPYLEVWFGDFYWLWIIA
jgi:hypothetical protein